MADESEPRGEDGVTPAGSAPEASGETMRAGTSAVSVLFALVFGLAFWGVLAMLVASIWSDAAWALVQRYWPRMAGIAVAALVLMGVVRALENRLATLAPATRRAVLAFVAVPVFALAVLGIGLLAADYAAFALEAVFILVAALMPAGVYYLFLNMRRASILNEFLSNLGRLGLLARRRAPREGDVERAVTDLESVEECRTRVAGYLQRFEAVYGALRFQGEGGAPETHAGFVRALLASIEEEERASAAAHRPARSVPTAEVLLADMFRTNLIIPLGLVTVLSALGWLLVLQPVWVPPHAVARTAAALQSGFLHVAAAAPDASSDRMLDLAPHWTPVNFAFLGAYFFGLQTIFRRFARRDLGPNAFLAFATRVLLAVIAVWVTVAAWAVFEGKAFDVGAAMANEQWPPLLLVLAFVVGVFPRVLWQIIGKALSKIPWLQIAVPSFEPRLPLSDLDGLTVWHETRLEEEDVENVPNMATVDVIDLMLHTQIPAERLVSWVDQAILYTVLGPGQDDPSTGRRALLRGLGQRSATQVVHVYETADDAEKKRLEAALNGGQPGGPLPLVVRAIRVEANFEPVAAWRGI